MNMEESIIQALAESFLLRLGIPFLHLTTAIKRRVAGRFYTFPVEGMTGWPDLLIYLPKGRHLMIELKTESGKLSNAQKNIHAQLESLGHQVLIIRSFEEFKKIIKKEMGVKR